MSVLIPRIAVGLAGFCAFLNLYAPQALLPSLAHEFGVGAAAISTIMTASTLAIALTAPFTGAVADVLGRKRVITAAMIAVVVPTTLVGLAADVHQLVLWRFIQGLLLPPIFAVTVAYIGDEWPPSQVTSIAGIYTAGSSLGGFSGRLACRIPSARGLNARRRHRYCVDAAARAQIRALGWNRFLDCADGTSPAESAVGCDLCCRLWSAV
jgi:MFS family permease